MGTPQIIDRKCSIELADLQRNEKQSVLYELILPSRYAGVYRIASVSVSYEIPGQGVYDNVNPQDVTITYTDDPSQASAVTPKVMQIVDSVSIFRQQTRALQLAQEGERGKATQLLRSAATQLLQQGQKELADQALSEANRLERGSAASAAGTKKLEYGTRKLTQLLSEVPDFDSPSGVVDLTKK